MKKFVFACIAAGTAIIAIAFGCSGGGSPTSPSGPVNSNQNASLAIGDITQTGNELSVSFDLESSTDLRALSFRIGFDPSGLKPLDVQWGDCVGEDDSTFELMDRDGFVPVAVACFTGPVGFMNQSNLCTIRFEIIDPTRSMPWIIEDPAYLVARDIAGSPVALQSGGESR